MLSTRHISPSTPSMTERVLGTYDIKEIIMNHDDPYLVAEKLAREMQHGELTREQQAILATRSMFQNMTR